MGDGAAFEIIIGDTSVDDRKVWHDIGRCEAHFTIDGVVQVFPIAPHFPKVEELGDSMDST